MAAKHDDGKSALTPYSGAPLMQLREICREYEVGDQVVHALDHVDLDIDAGEYISIMGPSGSGKSTLLNILGLLDRPTSGTYRLNGEDVAALDDDALAQHRQAQIGFVFQFFHLIPRLTAIENVELPMILAGVQPRVRRERARKVLESVGLGPRMHHRPDQLSGGERQRVAIGRAIVMEPRVLLADEPTGNLDSKSGGEIVEIIEQLNRDGIALVVVTHDPEIGRRARRHLTMRDGKIHSDEPGEGAIARAAGPAAGASKAAAGAGAPAEGAATLAEGASASAQGAASTEGAAPPAGRDEARPER